MAITDAYATAAEYRADIKLTDPALDAQINDDLLAVSRYIERRLHRFFTKDDSDQTRIYIVGQYFGEPVGGHKILTIDDLSSTPTSIKIDEDGDGDFSDETALTATEYEMLPLNATLGPEPEPYTQIQLTPWGDQGSWPHLARVQIIGPWGWPAVPEAIKRGCIEITAIKRGESFRATNRIQEGMDTSIEASPQAQGIIRDLINVYERKL